MGRERRDRRPVVLTVKGKAAGVVQDAGAYQCLLDIAAHADAAEGIRRGLEDAKREKLRPAREFFTDFEAGHSLRLTHGIHGSRRQFSASKSIRTFTSTNPNEGTRNCKERIG
jgi:hypothetical protein